MNLRTSQPLLALVLSLLFLGGCDNTQTENRQEPQEPYPLATLDAPCGESGITARDILSDIQPEYRTVLKGRPENDSTFVEPVGLTIRVAYRGGDLICHPAFVPPPESSAPVRPAWIEMELQGEVVTVDGSFQETFRTPLRRGTLSPSFRPEEIQGTYTPNLPEWREVTVGFSMLFDGEETWGRVVKTGHPPGKTSTLVPVARWNTRE